VIDDEKAILNYHELLLRDNDCSVEKVNSCEQALQKIAAGNYDFVIVDLMLDEYSGIDILKNACQQDDRPEVILMTGRGSIPSVLEAIKEGAFDYVAKPFDSKLMIITVRQALEIEETTLDFTFTDVTMQGMNRRELTEKLFE
jgi:DNA-binding NtrC family response regulator